MDKVIHDYCVGCGLCQSLEKAELVEDKKGYMSPVTGDRKWLYDVCPAGGSQCRNMDFEHIWGRTESVYYAWSFDPILRKKASSGGALTEIASYLLESHRVDAVLHTCAANEDPTKTVVCISTTRDELIARSGSRYAISRPLSMIANLDDKKKYAFIGKPCDVTALKNYQRINPDAAQMITITLSFFLRWPSKPGCAGKVD